MASKGPRSKLDHETRARRQKALEAPREPCRPKTHWDHVLEEMIWLSKDFEAERKWKLAQAKKVASRASRGMLDQATRGEKRMKEEEQRMRKIALNISKDVKKFWTKVEKLVLYKHQLELDDKKKKALDKQLEYLLGQTERYSTMLAENLMGASNACPSEEPSLPEETSVIKMKDSNRKMLNSPEALAGSESDTEIKTHGKEGYELSTKSNSYSLVEISTDLNCLELEKQNDDADESLELLAEAKSDVKIETNVTEADDDYDILSEDELEDDEQTIEEDEALITEAERQEELAALHNEVDLPLEEILKRYSVSEVNGESYPDGHSDAIDGPDDIIPGRDEDPDVHPVSKAKASCSVEIFKHHRGKSNGILESRYQLSEVELDQHRKESDCVINSDLVSLDYDFRDDQADVEFAVSAFEEKDNIRVLLDASMEQPDRELLLQRHFTALLTSVWRMTSSLDRNRNHSVSTNMLYPSIRLFGTSVNPNAHNSTRGQSKKFFDLNHVNMIKTALHDAGKVGSDDTASKQMEEDPPTIDQLDVVVEFGRESGENGGSPVDFPSTVSLSVPDFASPVVKIPSDQNQLRHSQHLPESRYRASLSACLDGVLGWASSAFPVIEPRSRPSLKSPSTGKHKLGVGESSRQSKLKLRKVAGEPSYSHVPFGETLFHPPSVSPSKPPFGSNSHTPPILDCSFEDLFKNIPDGLDEESSLTSSIPEMVPHFYNPSLISGLDDCSLLELSDIG